MSSHQIPSMEGERFPENERQRFFRFIENLPVIVTEIGWDGIIKFVNKKTESESGYSRAELVGKHYLEIDLINPKYHASLKSNFEKAQQGYEIQSLEVEGNSKSGKSIYFEINAIPLEESILTVINNITGVQSATRQLKKAYDELEIQIQNRTQQLQQKNQELKQEIKERTKIEEELRGSQQKLALVIDSIPQFIFWKDRNCVYQGCNTNFALASGVESPENIVGKTDYDLAWTKSQADFFIESDRWVMENDTPEYNIVEPQTQADGKKAWVNTNKIPLHNLEGEVIGILGTYEDVTEKLAIQRKEKVREQQLVQADKMISLGILVSGVAHEINNPNQFIMSHLTPLKRAFDDALPILEKYSQEFGDFRLAGMNFTTLKQRLPNIFANLISGSQRIKNIIEELREYITEYPSEHLESIQFNNIVESALTLLENLIRNSTHSFKVNYGSNLPFIKGHYQRLEQVVINLVQNACQALTSKAESILIHTEFDKEENHIVFTVEDEGCGIPREHRDRVTDLFFTTKRDIGGTGLGLAISSKIIMEHEGKLKFSPKKPKGTIATVSLPLKREHDKVVENFTLMEKLFTDIR